LPVFAHRSRLRRANASSSVTVPDQPVGTGTKQVEPGRPAPDARALPLDAVGTSAAPGACELLEPQLGRCSSIRTGLDHVEHHLHAGPDALGRSSSGDEVGSPAEVELVASSGLRLSGLVALAGVAAVPSRSRPGQTKASQSNGRVEGGCHSPHRQHRSKRYDQPGTSDLLVVGKIRRQPAGPSTSTGMPLRWA